MKTIKRSIALVLAMILTLAMSVTVFAAPNADQNTFSLTLNKAVKGHTYEAYQILSGDLSADKATLSNISGERALQKQDRLLSAVMLLVMLKNSVVLVTTLQSLKSRRRLLVQT
ncbi:MAG: hypothetical protein ACLRRR_08500 [Agathobacter rectalis]